MKSRGQFFLMAALVVSLLVISLATVYVSTNFRTDETPGDLLQEIQYESARVIDYFVYNSTERDIPSNLSDFVGIYADNYPDNEVLFVYGNGTDFHSSLFKRNITSSASLNLGGEDIGQSNDEILEVDLPIIKDENNLTVIVGDFNYTFELTEGYNFFLVIKKEVQNETIVVQG